MKHLLSLSILLLLFTTAIAQTVTLRVNQPDPLQINASKTLVTILKGNHQVLGDDLSISGGTVPYKIGWTSSGWSKDSVQNTITVSPADTTTYTCKVTDANGCTQEHPFQINVVTPVQLKLVATQISCFGKKNGTINMDISGGAKPYTIAWLDGSSGENRNNLGAGTYAVTVTDAMNQKRDTTITLIEQARIEVALTASVCEGGSYFFDNKKLTTAGNYTATFLSADGCDSLISLNLTVNPLPEIPMITQSGNTLSSSSTTGNQWWKDGVELAGENGQQFKFNETGIYSVSVTNNNGCSSQSATFNATYTGIDTYEASGIRCNVFPNPNNGIFTVELESGQQEPVKLELISVDGKTIASKQLDATYGKQTISFGKENLVKGVYTLRIQSKFKTLNRKLVVN